MAVRWTRDRRWWQAAGGSGEMGYLSVVQSWFNSPLNQSCKRTLALNTRRSVHGPAHWVGAYRSLGPSCRLGPVSAGEVGGKEREQPGKIPTHRLIQVFPVKPSRTYGATSCTKSFPVIEPSSNFEQAQVLGATRRRRGRLDPKSSATNVPWAPAGVR